MNKEDRFVQFVLRKKWGDFRDGLDQDILLDSVTEHMVFLKALVRWVLVFALGASLAILQDEKIKLMAVSFDKLDALYFFSIFLFGLSVVIFVALQRLGDLILLLDDDNYPKGFTKLSSFPWFFNPYAYFGGAGFSRIHEAVGYGGLILIWFLCMAPIIWLSGLGHDYFRTIVIPLLFALALYLRYCIGRVFLIVRFRSEELQPEVLERLKISQSARETIFMVSFIAGFILWLSILIT